MPNINKMKGVACMLLIARQSEINHHNNYVRVANQTRSKQSPRNLKLSKMENLDACKMLAMVQTTNST
eukprot:m.96788 g.96788  ORF g.96788 m.96788 type:complete len:68 (-) comp13084_c2_seq3:922-1125(-)